MALNVQSRKWTLIINNPQDYGLNHEAIVDTLHLFNPNYCCMADEIGENGTPHTHIFLFSHSPIRFNTLKNRFPVAHIEKCSGTAKQNRDYITKSGKWEETTKAETSIEGSFLEFGELPTEREEKSPTMFGLLGSVESGMSTAEIVKESPNLVFHIKQINELRETLTAEEYSKKNRDVEVIYLFGDTETGKTRSIYEKHDAVDICRITDYEGKNGVKFDAYHGQSVLVFEEFHSQIPIPSMLNYLDIYPLQLPARYHDRTACFTTVYITSNTPLDSQYIEIQENEPKTWNAFLRRIDKVFEFRTNEPPQEVKK